MKNDNPFSAAQVRSGFIDFFTQRGHTFVPSSSLLPADDPTLLFANAGMNQFKDIFLGRERRPYVRAANSQKCIRAGGKHNDLEDVGHDVYHHTFFEMLGNWSFGDYFKKEAIGWAWELLTGVWGLPKERLYATVFGGEEADKLPADDEAAELWRTTTDIDPGHIGRYGQKDNFWAPGDTGPCGPCSEIHIDLGGECCNGRSHPGKGCAVNVSGCGRFIELWNLVFMQFNRDAQGRLAPLPACHVDTGMGFERVCRVLQGRKSNYAIDLFVPILQEIETLTAHRYGSAALAAGGAAGGLKDRFDVGTEDDMGDVACRVVADHARALTFGIADGIIPSNEGRGYVLRRILRRAARYGRQYLKIEGPFLAKLVPTIVDLMGDAFPEVRQRQKVVIETIDAEEESFDKTLDRGIELWWAAAHEAIIHQFEEEQGLRARKGLARRNMTSAGSVTKTELEESQRQGRMIGSGPWTTIYIHEGGKLVEKVDLGDLTPESIKRICESSPAIYGKSAFELYATFGFPIDLTELMAKELGLSVDMAGFEKAMAEHREVSSAGGAFQVEAVQNLPATDAKAKYSLAPMKAKVLGFVREGRFVTEGELAAGEESAVVLDKTNFYGEQGGQVGDCGRLSHEGGEFVVRAAALAGECVLHMGRAQGAPLRVGAQITAKVDAAVRRDTMRNHTATHLLNWALRKVLGDHVAQAGSVVAPDRLRFDFTHNQAVTPEQLAEVERLVNQRVLDDVPVVAGMMPLAQAKQIPGVQAVFGEKYPDPVRVIVTGSGEEGGAGERSAEFCGGTHLERTGQVGPFKIVSEESVAKGVRRLTALSGMAAVRHIQEMDASARQAAALLRVSAADVPARIEAMQKELKALRKAKAGGAGEGAATWTAIEAPGGKVVIGQMDGADAPALRTACDVQRQKGAVAVFVGAVTDEKVTLVAMVSEELARSGKLSAGEWVKAVAPAVGGSGGGKPTLAQAGGREAAKLPDALRQAADWAKARLRATAGSALPEA